LIACLSPAKNLNFERTATAPPPTLPQHLQESTVLIERLREMSNQEIKSLMGLSDRLAELNVQRYSDWKPRFDGKTASPSLIAFDGDVYKGLDVETLDQEDLAFAQEHVRILSGLHGVLRPLDLIRPYRLEMGTRLEVAGSANLYEFWGDRITEDLNNALEEQGSDVLVNLASQEYFKSVKPRQLRARVIQPVFKDKKNGKYSVFFVYAKRARGMMTRFIVKNRVARPEDLKGFDLGGYAYNEELSSDTEWVFTREKT
jgi:cytoplasmic iron level regulating protein YaaA (DUF328/UPF0246 family)